MAKQRTHSLRVNITTSAQWTQLLDETGAAYVAKNINSVFAEVESLMGANLGAQSGTLQFGFSPTSTVVNSGIVVPPKTLATNEDIERTALRILRAGEGIWAMGTATNCNFVAAATLREVSGE